MEMKKIFLYIFLFIITYSCSNNEVRKDEREANLNFYQITNEILLREVEMFLDSVSPTRKFKNTEKKIMCISVMFFEDTILYTFYYPLSPYIDKFYSKVNDNIIAIDFYQARDFILSDNLAWEYLKEFFPDEYDYYLENDDFPVPITGGGTEWKLLFHDGKLIKKVEYQTQ